MFATSVSRSLSNPKPVCPAAETNLAGVFDVGLISYFIEMTTGSFCVSIYAMLQCPHLCANDGVLNMLNVPGVATTSSQPNVGIRTGSATILSTHT